MNKTDELYELELEVKTGVERIFVVIDEIIITELIKIKEKSKTNIFCGSIKAKLAIEKQDQICLWLFADEFGSTEYTNKDLFVNEFEISEASTKSGKNKQQNQIIVYPPENIEAVLIDVPKPLINVMSIPRVIFLYKEPLLENDIMNLRKLKIKNRAKFACTFNHTKLGETDMEKIGFMVFTAYWYRTLIKIKYEFPKPNISEKSEKSEKSSISAGDQLVQLDYSSQDESDE